MNYRIVVPRLEGLKNVVAEIRSIHDEYIEAMKMLYKLEEGKFASTADQIGTFIGFGYRLVRIANVIETTRNKSTDPNKRRLLTQAIIDLLGCGMVSDYYQVFQKLPSTWKAKHKKLGEDVYNLCLRARAAKLKFGSVIPKTAAISFIANTLPAQTNPHGKYAIARVTADDNARTYFVVDLDTEMSVCAHHTSTKSALADYLWSGCGALAEGVMCPRCAGENTKE